MSWEQRRAGVAGESKGGERGGESTGRWWAGGVALGFAASSSRGTERLGTFPGAQLYCRVSSRGGWAGAGGGQSAAGSTLAPPHDRSPAGAHPTEAAGGGAHLP